MRWVKGGRIYCVAHFAPWAMSHTHKPTAILLNEDNILRVYFGVRDSKNRTSTAFIDVKPDDPREILYEHDKPVLMPGKLGTFDDAGANVSCVVRKEELLYMYYIGWNTSTTVPSRNSIGLAVSEDNGLTYERAFDGPIMDRTRDEPYYTVAPFVLRDDEVWKMWYTSGTGWQVVDGKPEVKYYIKYAISSDGIEWQRPNLSCVMPRDEGEVTARPSVVKGEGRYRMWYSYRRIRHFRVNRNNSYRIGFAESKDGRHWNRNDEVVGIDLSNFGWDSQMIAYPYVYKYDGRLFMLYNGNGFGASGFGYAVLEGE